MSRYDWDPEKARVNLLKHGVLFEEAEEMLQNAQSEERPDATHSFGDVRIRTIGYTARSRLIVVITSIGGPRPRIISARRATKRERREYQARP